MNVKFWKIWVVEKWINNDYEINIQLNLSNTWKTRAYKQYMCNPTLQEVSKQT